MSKRVVNSMVAFVTTACMMAGCGQSVDENDSVTTPETSAAETTADGVEESTSRLTEEEVTFTFAISENAALPISENMPAWEEAARITGVRLEPIIIPSSEYATKMSALYASDELPDLFYVNPEFVPLQEMVDDGALLDLTDLVEEYAPNIKNDFENIPDYSRTKINNKIYTIGIIRRDTNQQPGTVGMIRGDLLEENNLPMPTTWEELRDTLATLHEIYPDMIPYAARGQDRLIGVDYLSVTRSIGADYNMYRDENNVWHLGRIEERYRDFLEFMRGLYSDGILDSEYLTKTLSNLQEECSAGKVMFFYENPTFVSDINKNLAAQDSDAYFTMVPLLENQYGETANYRARDHKFSMYGVSANCKNPELMVKFLNWAYSEEGAINYCWGVEGDSFEYDSNGEPQWTQETLDEYVNADNGFYKLQSDYGLNTDIFSPSWLYTIYDPFLGDGWNQKAVYDFYKEQDDLFISVPVDPPFTIEQRERLTEIKQDLTDYGDTMINQIIMGIEPLEKFDEMVDYFEQNGALEMEQIYNDAEQTYQEMNGN